MTIAGLQLCQLLLFVAGIVVRIHFGVGRDNEPGVFMTLIFCHEFCQQPLSQLVNNSILAEAAWRKSREAQSLARAAKTIDGVLHLEDCPAGRTSAPLPQIDKEWPEMIVYRNIEWPPCFYATEVHHAFIQIDLPPIQGIQLRLTNRGQCEKLDVVGRPRPLMILGDSRCGNDLVQLFPGRDGRLFPDYALCLIRGGIVRRRRRDVTVSQRHRESRPEKEGNLVV